MPRSDRISELLKKEISEIIQKKISDPRIGFVSITHVDVTDDLKNAKVHVSVFENDKKKKSTMIGLNSAKGFIRNIVASHLELKSIPEISFKLDNSIERASRVFKILNKLESERGSSKSQ